MDLAGLSGREAFIHQGMGRQALSLGCQWPLEEEGSKCKGKQIQEAKKDCVLVT